ncbi:hypothetical protein GC163_06265 [bacterium]|nr:hypothetical protein [bacterium]
MVLNEDILRTVVIEILRKERPQFGGGEPFQVDHLFREVAEIAKQRGLEVSSGMNAWTMKREIPELHANLRAPIWRIVWDLIIEGVIRPGRGTSEPFDLPCIHVTEHGKTAISGSITPYDPSSYLQELKKRIPAIDSVIERYLAESAETLRRNCILSSTVTLGCASEKAFLLLSDAYRDALNPPAQAAYDRSLSKARGIKQHHDIFMKEYEKLSPKLKSAYGPDWLTGMNNAMIHVFSYFRDMRNSAGHPSGYAFTKELAASHLMIFPYYLRLIYDLIEWCDSNKPI